MKTITRYIPQNSTPIEREGIQGIVYSYKNQYGNLCAIAYAGKSSKATWHYNFKSPAMREARINQFFEGLARREAYKQEREPSEPLKPIPVLVVLLIAALPGIIVAIVAIIFNFLK